MNNGKEMAADQDQEIPRKRKSSPEFHIQNNDWLTLSLPFPSSSTRAGTLSRTLSPVHSPAHPQPPVPPTGPPPLPLAPAPFQPPLQSTSSLFPHHSSTLYMDAQYLPEISASPTTMGSENQEVYRREPSGPAPSSRRTRQKRSPKEGNSETIPVPYPWTTDRRATVHKLSDLLSKEIYKITGQVQCKRCEKKYEMEFDLQEKFNEVGKYVAENKDSMHDRAPGKWMNPVLPACKFCDQENCVKPIISNEMDSINWLFLLLGEMIGLCRLDQLKHFCKHTKNHCTGAKDRLVYLTYLALCKQLVPDGPFDR